MSVLARLLLYSTGEGRTPEPITFLVATSCTARTAGRASRAIIRVFLLTRMSGPAWERGTRGPPLRVRMFPCKADGQQKLGFLSRTPFIGPFSVFVVHMSFLEGIPCTLHPRHLLYSYYNAAVPEYPAREFEMRRRQIATPHRRGNSRAPDER